MGASPTSTVPAEAPRVAKSTLRSTLELFAEEQNGFLTLCTPCLLPSLQRPLASLRVGTDFSALPDEVYIVGAPSGGCCFLQLRWNPSHRPLLKPRSPHLLRRT